jgi:hypothetical protein
MTARAERGPQWDVGTQLYAFHVHSLINFRFMYSKRFCRSRFQVDEGSELFYDPTLLLESRKAEKAEEETQQQRQHQHQEFNPHAHGMSPTSSRSISNHPPSPAGGYPYSPHVQRNYPGGPFSSVPPGQYYNGEAGSPMRMGGGHDMMGMGGMGGMGVGGMGVGGMGMGGMGMGGMGMSPVGRRVTRGMVEEFGGM